MQLLPTESRAVALIATSSRSYFKNMEPPIEVFTDDVSHLFGKPTLMLRRPT